MSEIQRVIQSQKQRLNEYLVRHNYIERPVYQWKVLERKILELQIKTMKLEMIEKEFLGKDQEYKQNQDLYIYEKLRDKRKVFKNDFI